jgi:phospholipid/cholesterol/gamma-HCH transport system substrate-binding protein
MKLETKVGAFFIGALAVLGILVFRMDKLEFGSRKDVKTYSTSFDQVAGLNEQGPVRVAGVKVGSVHRIKLENGRARVYITVPRDFQVNRDATASLAAIGILGEKYIDLDVGHAERGPHEEDQPIKSKTSVSLDQLMETMGAIGQDVKGITYSLNQSIGGEAGRSKLDEIVDNVRMLTAEIRTMAQENHGSINRTMANVEAMSGDLRERLPRLATQFEELGRNLNGLIAENRPELKGAMQDVRKLANSFQETSANLKSITAKLDRGEGTIGKLLTDETTIKKINTAVDSVNEMLSGYKALDLRLDLSANRWTSRGDSQTGLGIDLVPRKDYWYSLQLNSTPDGKIADSTRTITKIDPFTGLPVEVVEKTRNITSDQALTVSAQFAKRLGDNWVLSAGIVEGKGGGGAEFRTLDDRFRLGALAYDFTKRDGKEKPRYRVTGSYQLWKNLYLSAGWQDLANKDLRTFFFGGGIRWKDDDLKKLVGLASAGK